MRGFSALARSGGFTLIELLVVMAIIAILVIIAVPNYNAYNQAQKLYDSAAQLQSVIRNAQNNAITGTVCNSGNSASGKWSVNFTTAVIYKLSSTCRDGGTPSGAVTYTLPSEIELASVVLSSGTTECPLVIGTDYSDANPLLDFKTISGEADFAKFNCTTKDLMTIRLKNSSDDSKKVDVIVEKGGGVYVKKP